MDAKNGASISSITPLLVLFLIWLFINNSGGRFSFQAPIHGSLVFGYIPVLTIPLLFAISFKFKIGMPKPLSRIILLNLAWWGICFSRGIHSKYNAFNLSMSHISFAWFLIAYNILHTERIRNILHRTILLSTPFSIIVTEFLLQNEGLSFFYGSLRSGEIRQSSDILLLLITYSIFWHTIGAPSRLSAIITIGLIITLLRYDVRGAIIALGLSAVLVRTNTLLWCMRNVKIITFAAVVSIGLLVFNMDKLIENGLQRVQHEQIELEEGSQNTFWRLNLWRYAVQSRLNHPEELLFGDGLGKPVVLDENSEVSGIGLRYEDKDNNLHNTYLTLYWNYGLIGLALYALFYLQLFKFVLMKYSESEQNLKKLIPITACLFAAILQGITTPMFDAGYNSLFIATLAALGMRYAQTK